VIVGRRRHDVRVAGLPDLVSEQNLSIGDLKMPANSLKSLDDTGAARVTISMEMKDNDYGRGFGAFASVSLACRQDSNTVEQAYAEASDLAAAFVHEAFLLAEERYRALRPS
jgi:hypothetical protein